MTNFDARDESDEFHARKLHQQVSKALKNQVQSLAIEVSEGGITIRGTCDSFYIKQLAQEAIRKCTPRRIQSNLIVVRHQPLSMVSRDQSPSTDPLKATDVNTSMIQSPRFDRIFHPSDFSSASEIAFFHALMIAMKSRATLQMMHVDANNKADWDHFPSVHSTLQRWQVLPEGSVASLDEQLDGIGLEVSKIIASNEDPVEACLEFFEVNDVDLIVLSVHQREGIMRWLGPLVGERISAGSKQNTLFIPVGETGFVSQLDGKLTLRNILIPIVKKPRPEASVRFVQKLIHSMGLESGMVTLLHVGPSDTMPFVQHPLEGEWVWNRLRLEGDRIDSILQVASAIKADLIVMTTDGPDRFLDGLRGTTSERVLRRANCPVAVIPVESDLE